MWRGPSRISLAPSGLRGATSRRSATRSRVVGAAVHGQHLAGHEVAVAGGEKDQRAEQILRVFVALDGAALDGRRAGFLDMDRVGQAGVAQRIAGRQRVDADAVLAEL